MIYKDILDKDLYPVLFADSVPVKGASRSAIYDLSRNGYAYIPNILFEILSDNTKTISQLINIYGQENEKYIIDYFEFLIDKNFLFFSNTPENFPRIDWNTDTPSIITNAIIDVDVSMSLSIYYKSFIIELSEKFGCKYFQIRIYDEIDLNSLEELLSFFSESRVLSIEIILKYSQLIDYDKLRQILKDCPRITKLIYHSVDKDLALNKKSLLQDIYPVFFSKTMINSCIHCGVISNNYFSIDINTFSESKNYNSCLNKKISIDNMGNIKNCPSMKDSFGNIKNTCISDVIEDKKFINLWSISKDKIDVCKDCEFRYMCTDCRAYLKDMENLFSQPSKCAYNPYISKWENEQEYISVEEWRMQNPDWKDSLN